MKIIHVLPNIRVSSFLLLSCLQRSRIPATSLFTSCMSFASILIFFQWDLCMKNNNFLQFALNRSCTSPSPVSVGSSQIKLTRPSGRYSRGIRSNTVPGKTAPNKKVTKQRNIILCTTLIQVNCITTTLAPFLFTHCCRMFQPKVVLTLDASWLVAVSVNRDIASHPWH